MISPNVVLPTEKSKPFFMVDHKINYIHEDGTVKKFPDYGQNIRFKSKEFKITTDDDYSFVRKVYVINTKDLPPVIEGRVYIVSKIVANLISGYRDDFAYPGTHPKYDGAEITDGELTAVRRFRLPDQLVLKGV